MRVDYLALLNQMNRPEISSSDNAWTNYDKAISLFVEPDQELVESDAYKKRGQSEYMVFSDLDPNDQEKIRKWIESNNAAWQEFATGSSKSYCFREQGYAPDSQRKSLLDIAMAPLRDLRDLAKMGDWRIRIEIDKGQTRQAMEDCIVIAHAGSHCQGKANLIEQLVGLGISRLGCDAVLRIVAMHNLSAVELKELHQQLTRIYPEGYPHINIEGERLMFLDTVQQLFTEGGPGGGHLIPEKLIDFSDLTDIGGHSNDYDRIITIPICTALGMVHARRDETVAVANQIYDHGRRGVKMTPYEKRANNIPNMDDIIGSMSKFRFALLQILMPAIWRCSEIMYRGKALHEATVTILALKHWQLEENEYPSDLSELVTAGFLKELPMDPYSDKPLVYRRQGGDFILYGLGPNFTDDGGEVGLVRGKPRRWGTSEVGDVIYWPLPESEEE
jgi:hypothetical protein